MCSCSPPTGTAAAATTPILWDDPTLVPAPSFGTDSYFLIVEQRGSTAYRRVGVLRIADTSEPGEQYDNAMRDVPQEMRRITLV